jgi:hypothetical protein
MMRHLVLCLLTFFGEDGVDEGISGGGRWLTLRFRGLSASLLMVVVWWMGCGKVVATGLKDGTVTISKVLLFICNSAPQNLSHCHKNS